MQLAIVGKTFDRGDRPALVLHRKRQTGQNALAAVRQHRAGPARALVAAFLRTREVQMFAQQVQQGHARVVRQVSFQSIDCD